MLKLMNYIYLSFEFEENLRVWAQDLTLTTPKFFFWRAGSREQRSTNGLLRSLLHQILSCHPSCSTLLLLREDPIPFWTNESLQSALQVIIAQTLDSMKICFLIDGLDESDEGVDSQRQLMNLVKDLSRKKNVKYVISSRPEPWLIVELSSYSSLRLQDLTEDDICTYVQGRLLSEPTMQRHQAANQGKTDELIHMLCRKADGVFLWTRLATQDIVRGLQAEDSIDVLLQRIELLRSGLDRLFVQLLEYVDPVHQARAAKYLAFVREWNNPNMEPPKLTLLHIAFAYHSEFASTWQYLIDTDPSDDDRIQWCIKFLDDLALYLPSHSAGLLDVSDKKCADMSASSCGALADLNLPAPESLLGRIFSHIWKHTTVQLIHRSALDFLSENDQGRQFMNKGRYVEYELHDMISKALQHSAASILFLSRNILSSRETANLANFQRVFDEDMTEDFESMVNRVQRRLGSGSSAEKNRQLTKIGQWLAVRVQSILDAAITNGVDSPTCETTLWCSLSLVGNIPSSHLFLATLIRHREYIYVRETLTDEHKGTLPILFLITLFQFSELERFYTWISYEQEIPHNGLQKALELLTSIEATRCDPNARPVERPMTLLASRPGNWTPSVWEEYLCCMRYFTGGRGATDYCIAEDMLALAESFIMHGANASASILDRGLVHNDNDMEITMRLSALYVIQDFRSFYGIHGDRVIQRLEVAGGHSFCNLSGVLRREAMSKSFREVSHSSEKQQAAVVQAYEQWKRAEQCDSLERDRRCKEFSQILMEIWEENKDNTVLLNF